MELEHRRVVVLGGTGGFGFATAQAVVAEGARVVVASPSPDKVARAVERLGPAAEGRTVDIGDEAALERFFSEIGALDHLVTAVGEPIGRLPFATTPPAEAQRMFRTRFWGQYNAARLAAPQISREGSITLTSGSSSQRGMPGFVLGGSVCAAVEGLTRQLAVELAPVRVNCVSAGIVDTPLWAGMPEAQRTALFEQAGKRLPVGRVGRPEDIGLAYLYFIKNGFSTGTTLFVDGGALASGT